MRRAIKNEEGAEEAEGVVGACGDGGERAGVSRVRRRGSGWLLRSGSVDWLQVLFKAALSQSDRMRVECRCEGMSGFDQALMFCHQNCTPLRTALQPITQHSTAGAVFAAVETAATRVCGFQR